MTKVVVNRCFGGFGLSDKATQLLAERGVNQDFFWYEGRDNPILVAVVEELGSEANGKYAELAIVEVKEKYWQVNEYDGSESIIASDSPIVFY